MTNELLIVFLEMGVIILVRVRACAVPLFVWFAALAARTATPRNVREPACRRKDRRERVNVRVLVRNVRVLVRSGRAAGLLNGHHSTAIAQHAPRVGYAMRRPRCGQRGSKSRAEAVVSVERPLTGRAGPSARAVAATARHLTTSSKN